MSRSVNTMTIAGSLATAFQAASPSASSRTANEVLRMPLKVVRTNLESSAIRTRFCGTSADDMVLLREVDHDAAAHPGADEIVEHAGQVAQRDGARHFLQQRRLEIGGEAPPHEVADVVRAVPRV